MKRWRLPLLLALLVATWFGGRAVVRIWLSPPSLGKGPAGPTVPREPFEKTWSQRKVLLLGIGDSVTAGFGIDEDHSYFGRLVKNPFNEYDDMRGICLSAVLPNLDSRNISVSGSTSLHHVTHLREKLEIQPDDVFGLVVMTSGGNDIIHDYGRSPPREGAMYGGTLEQAKPWIANFEKRLDLMIDLIEERFPGGCAIFLADIYDPSDGVGNPQSARMEPWEDCLKVHAAYNEIIRRCAAQRESVHLVPMHAEFLGHGIHCGQSWREHYDQTDPHYWYAMNIEDPNHRGYDALRRVFLLEMIKAAEKIKEEP